MLDRLRENDPRQKEGFWHQTWREITFRETEEENFGGVFWSIACLVGMFGAVLVEWVAPVPFLIMGTGIFGLYFAYRAIRYRVLLDPNSRHYHTYKGWYARLVGIFLALVYLGLGAIGAWMSWMALKA